MHPAEHFKDSDRPIDAQYTRNNGPAGGNPGPARPELTLLVAGCRGGKSSFLRLLIDTSDVSQTASPQLQSLAKFVQGCSGHTTSIRTASIDIDVDGTEPLALTLVDTPSLEFRDESHAERVVSETLRFIESRLAEGGDEDWVAQNGDRYVHLCIYFLDPDQILPPAVAVPPAPLVSRARANSFSDQDPVILEPPVTTNPLLYRPTLPLAEISTIRRLSARVNVLPVIARADVLSNDRLAAIKMAIRRDLADNGIGFGIFDIDHSADDLLAHAGDVLNSYSGHTNGTPLSAANSPPASPVASPLLRLPYALVSPDIYSHSDGVPRIPPSRHELVLQYTPSPHSPSKKSPRGRFVRSYRWGTVDVLDPNHSDFMSLRAAIFHHMKTLQKYTREYLFDKFRIECLPQRPSSRHLASQHPQIPPSHSISLPHSSRPILAIDTAPRSAPIQRSTPHSNPREIAIGDAQSAPLTRTEPMSSGFSSKGSGPGSAKQRSKKITVACNFCRSRKLKCDGGRPSCSQCMKRSNTCDYMPQNKRRGAVRLSRGEESESDSGDDVSAEFQEPSLSPEVSSRRSSNFDTSPSLPLLGERRDELPPITTSSRTGYSGDQHSFFLDNELPHIATLSLPETSPSTPGPMSAPSLPPLRPASEQQAAQRKRSATVPGKSSRLPSTSGPKVVACNFCRARKTKCDGAHPACSSCARRLLPCNYVHDSNSNSRKASRRASTSVRSSSPPSSRMLPTPSSAGYEHRDSEVLIEGDMDLKRSLEHDAGRPSPSKKIKVDEEIPRAAGALT
ncbi:GTP binding protein [Mycena belliarum]|uniref:GTP binding protein n=1 Tax=Mycena belliarum TaxID=1033014 RepID=A0AAD6XXV5_9AGAR|nr:GTP binding protein [Mycena belliae]